MSVGKQGEMRSEKRELGTAIDKFMQEYFIMEVYNNAFYDQQEYV